MTLIGRSRALTTTNVHRGRLEIVKDILSVPASGGHVRKTRMMYGANLSYTSFTKYLNELLELGLVRHSERFYSITSKGEKFLELYEEFDRSKERLTELTETLEGSRKALNSTVSS